MERQRFKLSDELKNMLIAFRRDLHAHPELSMQEYETTAKIKQKLAKAGIEILDYRLKTGVLAIIRGSNPGKTIALRGDIDALPIEEQSGVPFSSLNTGIMHACGHDFHVANLLGAGIILQEHRHLLNGNVLLVFQPAEEGSHGAKAVCNTGVFEDLHVSSILGSHVNPGLMVGQVGLRYGEFAASSSVLRIEVKGKSGHAAHPEEAVDPVLTAAHIIIALQSFVSREIAPTDSAVISICKITAGNAFNVLPDKAVLEGTVRALNGAMLDKLDKAIARISMNVARAFRAEVKSKIIHGCAPLICDEDTVMQLEESLKRTIGDKNIIRIKEPSMGSDDFSEYSLHTKAAFCRIGCRGTDPRSTKALHSSEAAFDEGSIEVAVNSLVNYCMDVLI